MDTADAIELVGIILAFIGTNVGHLVAARTNYNKMITTLKEQSEKADAAFDKTMSVYSAKTDMKIEELKAISSCFLSTLPAFGML